MTECPTPGKKAYDSRMAAECALGVARRQWQLDRLRAADPPQRIYRCRCDKWHLTSKERRP